jgi:uncharacterized damage-inducible protein DinB
MKLLGVLILGAASLSAQEAKGPLVATSQGMFAIAKNDITRSMETIPEKLWSYRPTKDVRTIGEMFAHVADGQYEFCGPARGESVTKDIEKNAKTKAEITAGVKEAFAYCDAGYAKMSEANAVELVDLFGRKMTRLGAMDFNIAHTMEHYGNLTTYMRMNGIVPPSSTPQK